VTVTFSSCFSLSLSLFRSYFCVTGAPCTAEHTQLGRGLLSTFHLLLIKTPCLSCCSFRAWRACASHFLVTCKILCVRPKCCPFFSSSSSSCFSGTVTHSLGHFFLGRKEKAWSIITVRVVGGKKAMSEMFVFQDREHLSFVYRRPAASNSNQKWLLLRSNTNRSTSRALDVCQESSFP
jgi:hypothetical protein